MKKRVKPVPSTARRIAPSRVAVDAHLPVEAACAKGAQYWTMSHPASGRFELRFGVRTPHAAERWLANLFWLGFADLVGYLAWQIWSQPSEEGNFFLFFMLALIAGTIVTKFYPRPGMRVQELIIDRKAGTVSATGLVRRKRVTVVQQLDQLKEITYRDGPIDFSVVKSEPPAMIKLHFLEPGKTIRLDRLATQEFVLHMWLCLMVNSDADSFF